MFVSYAHVNLCHFFSSSWCRGLAAASACGSSWTFLFTFMESDESESPSAQEEEDETDSMEEEADTDEENAIAQPSTSDPWLQLLSQTYYELQENFDDTVENYLQQNPEMELQQAKEKSFSDLRSDYRRQLIKVYEGLMKLVAVLKTDPIHRQALATAKNLQISDDFGLEESVRFSIRKRKYLLDQMFDQYPRPSYSGEIQNEETKHCSKYMQPICP